MGSDKERFYKLILYVWEFQKSHLNLDDCEKFCEDMKKAVFGVPEEDQTYIREMLVAYENELVRRTYGKTGSEKM